MSSDHSQAPMSLISSSSQKTAVHQQQQATLIVATAAEGASYDLNDSQQNGLWTDFVLDESLSVDFLLKNPISINNSITDNSQSFSIESQMVIESLNLFDEDHIDPDFIQNLDVTTLLDEAFQAVIQSPNSALMPAMDEEIQLEGNFEFQSLLESIANEVSAQDDAVNSPSAEITYSHLAMTPLTSQEEEATSTSSMWSSLEDDASLSSPSVVKKGRRVNKSSGSVHKSKKESNKAAAERYRNKKQMEKLELFAECDRNEKRNKELKAEIEEVQVELNFIKNLLVEALLTKNSKS